VPGMNYGKHMSPTYEDKEVTIPKYVTTIGAAEVYLHATFQMPRNASVETQILYEDVYRTSFWKESKWHGNRLVASFVYEF
jgi:hypothetical protein